MEMYNALTWAMWIGGGVIAFLIVAVIFALSYPWQSDPWGLTRWL